MVDERKYKQDDDVYERKLPRTTSKDWTTTERPKARDLKRK
ncbi:5897_t:CDS:1, partial [Ambispora leptoticha]